MKQKEVFIGIHSRAQSGKDRVADYLCHDRGFSQIAFARPLKLATEVMLEGVPHTGTEELKDETNAIVGVSERALWQNIGEACRQLNEEFFIALARLRLDVLRKRHAQVGHLWPVGYVFSDVRYENEAAWVRSLGGVIIHIPRPDAPKVREHVSEDGIAVGPGDIVITNNGTLEELYVKVKDVVVDMEAAA